ncbi:sensor histidine kinase [Haloimpatiens sp. FM7330]|uniref:sensor histidine kinase n=1 Tax=Haloimpatiens sp. FM7330 TaxID=3298610 RepID=UPI00362549A8
MKFIHRAYILIVLILLQSCIVLLLSNKVIINSLNISNILINYPLVISIIINLLGLSSIICIYYIISFLKKEKKSIEQLHNSKEVIEALRGQKHDFQNHLNIISGLIQLNKPEKALEYTHSICGKTNEIFSISKINNMEVAALLYRKYAIAENKGINVELDIDSYLENIHINSIDLCKILFNLIDNAIHELENCKEDEKILSIQISEIKNEYIITIINSYPILSEDLYDKIFQCGFTTKKASSHGYGLNIVKQLVNKNNGTITVESYDGVGTIFTVFLPMKQTQ